MPEASNVVPSTYKFVAVKLRDLYVPNHAGNESYQRKRDDRRVDAMVTGYDPDLMRPLMGNRRRGTRVAIFDGQHRLALLQRMYEDKDTEIMVQVLTRKASVRREAELFLRMAMGTQTLNLLDQHRAGVVAKHELHVQIHKAASDHGYKITADRLTVAGLVAIMKYRDASGSVPGSLHGMGLLSTTLRTVRAAFPTNEAPPKSIVVAVAKIIHAAGEKVQPLAVLAPKMQARGTEAILEGAAEYAKARRNGDRHSHDMANALVALYNEGMHGNDGRCLKITF